jgi:hypothetical protein
MAASIANEKPRSVRGLGEIALRVNNMDACRSSTRRSSACLNRDSDSAFFKIAEGYGGHTQEVALFDRFKSPGYSGTDAATSTMDHTAFEIRLADFAGELKRLRGLGLEVQAAEHAWIHWRSLYVADPEGNHMELVCYDASV